jgi:CheY-like chemotaxis protein
VSRVLVVDDSLALRALIRVRLERAGHQVQEVHDGQRMIELMGTWNGRPEADLLLLDGVMPGLPGYQALTVAKDSWPDLPVLAISSAWEMEREPEWAAADGFIRKPIDFEMLLGQIERVTTGRSLP